MSGNNGAIDRSSTHTISILVANKPGVLVRLAQVFSRRGYNIDSLVVSPTQGEETSRLTITARHEVVAGLARCHRRFDRVDDARPLL